MNGKHGDHPLTDILVHDLPVFTAEIDKLIKDIAALGGERELESAFNWFKLPQHEEFETKLREMYSKKRQEAIEKGWEGRP